MRQFFLIPLAAAAALLMVSCRSGKEAPASEQKTAVKTAPAPKPEPTLESRLRKTYGWEGGAVMPDGVKGYRAPEEALQKKAAEPMETYTVVKGDTLWGIARRKYGDGRQWEKILEANNDVLHGNTELKVGTRLLLPVPAK